MSFRDELQDYTGILAGSILFGMAYSWFLFPFRVSPGGVGGVAQVLYSWTGVPESIWMFGFNIPLFIIGYIFVGRQFGVRSLAGMMMSNTMCWVFQPSHLSFLDSYGDIVHNVAGPGQLPRLAVFLTGNSEMDILLASIAGSALLGIGLGLIFKFRGSTGGTDIPVAILKKYTGVSISTGYWMVESLIILGVGFVFRNPAIVIWAYLNLFITSRMTDFAAEGLPYVKAVIIVTDRPDDVRDAIFHRLNRGVTFLKARGGYSGEEKEVIYVCIHRRQVMHLRKLVRKIDPDAFMVLHDAHDVMGYGFRQRTLTY
ncbi:MAG: YitT family protein [Candidatus Fermentibacteraceae bacterium]|nr:YitT family protein [Candidatus Fermentibacteraceae bacterium]MBN2608260.1 YitT family protein [Candidatus Fermentibacteraceae bacterium]